MALSQCPDCGAIFRPGEPACPDRGMELSDDPDGAAGPDENPRAASAGYTAWVQPGGEQTVHIKP